MLTAPVQKRNPDLFSEDGFSVNSSCLILERLIYHELSGCSGSLSAPYELDSAKLHVQNLSLVPYTS